ncbi:MAG: TrkH family potassium uptake protein [Flavobacteriales bacterium]|nr:TrkH family potassium uptake protein [Flavobacteriales bacterium]
MFNFKLITNLIGLLLILNGIFMLTCLPTSIYFSEGDTMAILLSSAISINVGVLAWYFTRDHQKKLKQKDGYLIVTLGWLALSLSGSLPFIVSGTIPSFSSAFFETVSGYTTTGSSVLTDIEGVHKGILLWRSLTQWMGGMGIIVLTVAILPILGVGGMQLFMAESPGPSTSKLHPRITETAKRLWYIYAAFTLLEIIALRFAGMTWYDAINHSFTTVSTGGFSTKNASVAAYNSPMIHYIISIFMFFGGVNFTLFYFIIKLNWREIVKNEEFRMYLGLVVLTTIVTTVTLSFQNAHGLEQNFRDSLFNVLSIVTTTGFATADYTTWGYFLTLAFFLLMFFGASAGSTAGGIKIVRHVLIVKNGLAELKRLLHPSAIIPVRYNGRAVEQKIVYNILAFFFIYLTVFLVGTIVMSLYGYDILTSAGATISSLGNIGPGIGDVGPANNFSIFPESAKVFLAFLMLLGRLELFTILMLLMPNFWRNN